MLEQKQNNKGFTLIELLVVIAIIAMLLAILMPSLKKAKAIAQGVVCTNNTKVLAFGATAFAGDNDNKIPNSKPTKIEDEDADINENGWVYQPHTLAGVTNTSTPTFDDRVRGITSGTLYPYVEDHAVYHCIGDKRFSGKHHNYLSYAMPACILPDVPSNVRQYFITKFTQISVPSEKYIFLEESDTRPYPKGGWSLGTKYYINGGTPTPRDGWHDGMAVWHNNASTFGFADGHAESHKWHDKETLERANREVAEGDNYSYQAWSSGPRADLDWVQRHWPLAR